MKTVKSGVRREAKWNYNPLLKKKLLFSRNFNIKCLTLTVSGDILMLHDKGLIVQEPSRSLWFCDYQWFRKKSRNLCTPTQFFHGEWVQAESFMEPETGFGLPTTAKKARLLIGRACWSWNSIGPILAAAVRALALFLEL